MDHGTIADCHHFNTIRYNELWRGTVIAEQGPQQLMCFGLQQAAALDMISSIST